MLLIFIDEGKFNKLFIFHDIPQNNIYTIWNIVLFGCENNGSLMRKKFLSINGF